MGIWPTEQAPHDVDTCRLCRPAAEPNEDNASILGSLLPYNPVDRPLSASRPALADPWEAVALAQRFADDHAQTGRPLRLGHDVGRVEVAVAEVYATLTVAYGPVVRPSVEEVYTRVGCKERRAQYALRALQRAGLLHQHADGCVVRDAEGNVERLAAEYELRIPLAYVNRAQMMDELDEVVDRGRLELYLEAVALVRTSPAMSDAAGPDEVPVESHCTPSQGLLTLGDTRSSDTATGKDQTSIFTKKARLPRSSARPGPLSIKHPRTRRGYALARKLQKRSPRWAVVPVPVLAERLQPLADLGWSAFQIDRATETYGPVTSSTGLTRMLQAVVEYTTGADERRLHQIEGLARRIILNHLTSGRYRPVWTSTSQAARDAYDLAVRARTKPEVDVPPGSERLRAITEDGVLPSPRSVADLGEASSPVEVDAGRRSALIHARARAFAATERAQRPR